MAAEAGNRDPESHSPVGAADTGSRGAMHNQRDQLEPNCMGTAEDKFLTSESVPASSEVKR